MKSASSRPKGKKGNREAFENGNATTMNGIFASKDTIRNKKQVRQGKKQKKAESQAGKSWKKHFFLFFVLFFCYQAMKGLKPLTSLCLPSPTFNRNENILSLSAPVLFTSSSSLSEKTHTKRILIISKRIFSGIVLVRGGRWMAVQQMMWQFSFLSCLRQPMKNLWRDKIVIKVKLGH